MPPIDVPPGTVPLMQSNYMPEPTDRRTAEYRSQEFSARFVSGPSKDSVSGVQDVSQLQMRKMSKQLRQGNTSALAGIFLSPFSILLVFVPMGIAAGIGQNWDVRQLFWFNFFALIPLSKILGDATEELDANLNSEVTSGLINATLGNAVEVIITIMSLRKNMCYVVQASLLGSVLSNSLLVLGMSFFAGGILSPAARLVCEREQSFQTKTTLCSMSMLLLASLALALPTVFSESSPSESQEYVLPLSRMGSVIIACTYIAYLIFQLGTHKQMFQNAGDDGDADADEGGSDGSDEADHLSLEMSVLLLAVTTLFVAWNSQYLVDSVEKMARADDGESNAMGQAFISTILLPIVGNACEHMAAVRFAIADKPGLAVSIAIGSSTQIALFVVPFSVICGWMMDVPMDLNFGILNTSVMILTVMIVMSVVGDGYSNWLEGWTLMSAYLFVSIMYWYVTAGDDLE